MVIGYHVILVRMASGFPTTRADRGRHLFGRNSFDASARRQKLKHAGPSLRVRTRIDCESRRKVRSNIRRYDSPDCKREWLLKDSNRLFESCV